MKKIFAFFLAVLIAVSALSACSGDNSTNDSVDTTRNNNEDTATEETTVKGSFINGIDLSLFVIVYSDPGTGYNKRAAEWIKAEILTRTGEDVPVVEDTQAEAEYEIVVGETSRGISQRLNAETEGMQFSILAEDKQIALEGDYFIIAAAAYYFIDTYVPEDDYAAEVPKSVSVHTPIVEKADNFILLIGDGMGEAQTRLFQELKNNLEYGDGEDRFYGYYFSNQGYSRTNNYENTVTDSAAGGTALSTGYKTINGYIGQDYQHNEIQSLVELAGSLNKGTAVMSTEVSTGATPASFSAHADDRTYDSDITADQYKLQITHGTLIVCDYDEYTREGILAIESRINATLNALDQNSNGFFLMYEEAHIDKHCHNQSKAKTFRAVVRFNQTIATFMEYAFYHPNTFVLITADHETGGLELNKNNRYIYTSDNHTGVDVPVFAYGYGTEVFNGKTIENIQIPQTIASFMGVENFGDPQNYHPLTQ